MCIQYDRSQKLIITQSRLDRMERNIFVHRVVCVCVYVCVYCVSLSLRPSYYSELLENKHRAPKATVEWYNVQEPVIILDALEDPVLPLNMSPTFDSFYASRANLSLHL